MKITNNLEQETTTMTFSSDEWKSIMRISALKVCEKISDIYVGQFSKEIIDKININSIKSKVEDLVIEEIKKIKIKDIKN